MPPPTHHGRAAATAAAQDVASIGQVVELDHAVQVDAGQGRLHGERAGGQQQAVVGQSAAIGQLTWWAWGSRAVTRPCTRRRFRRWKSASVKGKSIRSGISLVR